MINMKYHLNTCYENNDSLSFAVSLNPICCLAKRTKTASFLFKKIVEIIVENYASVK